MALNRRHARFGPQWRAAPVVDGRTTSLAPNMAAAAAAPAAAAAAAGEAAVAAAVSVKAANRSAVEIAGPESERWRPRFRVHCVGLSIQNGTDDVNLDNLVDPV